MNKYLLTTQDGRRVFVTASSTDQAYEIAYAENPYDVFSTCVIYYEIS